MYISVYLCPVQAEIFNHTSRPKTVESGSKLDIWQPFVWVTLTDIPLSHTDRHVLICVAKQ